MRKAIKTLVIILLAVTAFILKPTDTRAEGTGKEYTHNFTTEDLTYNNWKDNIRKGFC